MKAAQISEYGDVDVVQINEIDKPTVSKDTVLVEVHASSLNPFDTKVRSGMYKDMMPLSFPATLGGDIAGVVVEVGEDVQEFAVGDKVYGGANVVGGNSGALAEFAVTKASQLGKIPANIDFKQAAAIALVGVSAVQALHDHIKLQSGQKIFIHGGAGGIGTVAIQMAKHLGAYVATTATGDNSNYVKQLGADEVIDYKTQDFAEILRDYDAVFDTVGGDDFTKSLNVLKKGGTAVSMAGQADEAKVSELGVTALTQSTQLTTERLATLAELVEAGAVTSHIDKVFPLDQIQEAFKAREESSFAGKIAIEIKA